MDNNTKIAGLKTVKNWQDQKMKLQADPSNTALWEEAFEGFLERRIKTRYYEPIEAISKIPKQQGKGFSIISIYCSLIEFFESLKKGYEFRYPTFYNGSGVQVRSRVPDKNGGIGLLTVGEIFIDFLTENPPFNSKFDEISARDFYYNVRCGILHQAETKSNWIINDGNIDEEIFIDNSKGERVLKWRPLKKAFDQYLYYTYKGLLLSDANIQNNFIFKWDKICQI